MPFSLLRCRHAAATPHAPAQRAAVPCRAALFVPACRAARSAYKEVLRYADIMPRVCAPRFDDALAMSRDVMRAMLIRRCFFGCYAIHISPSPRCRFIFRHAMIFHLLAAACRRCCRLCHYFSSSSRCYAADISCRLPLLAAADFFASFHSDYCLFCYIRPPLISPPFRCCRCRRRATPLSLRHDFLRFAAIFDATLGFCC